MIFKWYDIIAVPLFLSLIYTYLKTQPAAIGGLGFFVFAGVILEMYVDRQRLQVATKQTELIVMLFEKIDILEKALTIKIN
jgi:hypothetical protein